MILDVLQKTHADAARFLNENLPFNIKKSNYFKKNSEETSLIGNDFVKMCDQLT